MAQWIPSAWGNVNRKDPEWQQAANRFTPWAPPPIPSGYYDPSLDAQRQSASRGLLYTEQDVGLGGRRAQEDYGFETSGIERDWTRGVEDIDRQQVYANEDYNRNVGLLTRQYEQLGRRQGEQARKYGVTSGGIALLSAAKRNENRAIDQQALDTDWRRTSAGLSTSRSRLDTDRGVALDRSQTLYDRGVADRGTTLSRARSEDFFFGLDTGAQKQFQAQQAGYVAPQGPSNQFTRPDGTVVQAVRRNGYTYIYDSSGKLLDKRRAA